MLSNLSQFSPQGLLPQFPGLQTAGLPQMTPGLFGQPGAFNPYNSTGQFGHDSGQAGLSHPSAFGGQPNPFVQNPFIQNQFAPSPFAPNSFQANPYQHQQGPWLQSPAAYNPLQSAFGQSSFGTHPGGNIPVHQIVPVLGQLAQQIAVQSALAQQIGIAVQQLAQQLAAQGQQGYSGFNPQQAQGWGANRSQTIQ